MNWKSDVPALVFGMLIVLIIFGDAIPVPRVGNLDTVFGMKFWHLMDVVYPLASIVAFLAYGRSKGPIRVPSKSSLLLLVFLASLVMVQVDDIFVVFNHPITLPWAYWTAARWLYLVVASGTFLGFGMECASSQ